MNGLPKQCPSCGGFCGTTPCSYGTASASGSNDLLVWIDNEIADQEAMQETINLDHQDAEIECWNMHDRNILMLRRIRKIVANKH